MVRELSLHSGNAKAPTPGPTASSMGPASACEVCQIKLANDYERFLCLEERSQRLIKQSIAALSRNRRILQNLRKLYPLWPFG